MPKRPFFLAKTYELITESPSSVRWSTSDEQSSFVITNPEIFAAEILPRYFKHNNLDSFVRQLNTYGFKKINSRPGAALEFYHPLFQCGRLDLVDQIIAQKRKPAARPTTSVEPLSPSSMPSPTHDDADVEFLSFENQRLTEELQRSESSKRELQSYITTLLAIIAVQGAEGTDSAPSKKRRAALPVPPPPSSWTPNRSATAVPVPAAVPAPPRPGFFGSPLSSMSPVSPAPLSPVSMTSVSPMDSGVELSPRSASPTSYPSSPMDMAAALDFAPCFSTYPTPVSLIPNPDSITCWSDFSFPTEYPKDQLW